jgi:hypothetical protein
MLEDLDSFIVGQRAAQRAASPAHQLAAWLAGVWGSERDDEADGTHASGCTIDLVDDAAFDAVGPGTVLSLAGTAIDDTEVSEVPRRSSPTSAAVAKRSAAVDALRTPAALRRAALSGRHHRTHKPRLRCARGPACGT